MLTQEDRSALLQALHTFAQHVEDHNDERTVTFKRMTKTGPVSNNHDYLTRLQPNENGGHTLFIQGKRIDELDTADELLGLCNNMLSTRGLSARFKLA